jgi:predicted secreted protein
MIMEFIIYFLIVGSFIYLVAECLFRKEVKVDSDDNGRQIKLDKERYLGEAEWDFEGQILVITLEANWTNGYSWEIAEFDKNKLCLQGEPKSIRQISFRKGEQQVQILRFIPMNIGKTPLKLIYKRPQDIEPLKTFSIDVFICRR